MAGKKRGRPRKPRPEPDFGGEDFDEDASFDERIESGPWVDRHPPVPCSQEMRELGEPPLDPEKAIGWMFRAQTVALREAMLDPTLSAIGRRREMRTIAAAAAKLYPESARAKIAAMIQADREELAAKRRNRANAPLEKRPQLGLSAAVIPFRHAPAKSVG